MIRRRHGYLTTRKPETAPAAALALERDGCVVIPGILDTGEVAALAAEIDNIFATLPADDRTAGQRPATLDAEFRYEMLNRGALCQQAVGHPDILTVIEPLLGDDCHVIANTAWRNSPRPNDPAQAWHVDAGPHVPLPDGVQWPAEIPHPVFAIGCHIFLQPCRESDGPTGVIPGSHCSGRFPPTEERMNPDLTWRGQGVRKLTAKAGDVALFVSDVWHRRMPTGADDRGRFFLQVHYGRRDIAQRLQTTTTSSQVSDNAIARAYTDRARTLIGLHAPYFYDG